MSKLIAISGQARSGKNTVANILKLADSWEHSKFFQIRYPDKRKFILGALTYNSNVCYSCSTYKDVAFADILKLIIALIFGIDDYKKLWDEDFKNSENSLNLKYDDEHVYTYREIMQRLGTEAGRTIDPNIWINALFNTLKEDENYIITDVRFKNEADACISKGSVLIRIEREVPEMAHQSETDLKDYGFNYTIDNNGTIEELVDKVLNLNLI